MFGLAGAQSRLVAEAARFEMDVARLAALSGAGLSGTGALARHLGRTTVYSAIDWVAVPTALMNALPKEADQLARRLAVMVKYSDRDPARLLAALINYGPNAGTANWWRAEVRRWTAAEVAD